MGPPGLKGKQCVPHYFIAPSPPCQPACPCTQSVLGSWDPGYLLSERVHEGMVGRSLPAAFGC